MIGELLWVIFGGAFIGGKCLGEFANQQRSKRDPYWWTNKNYNLRRQSYYEQMLTFEREKAEEILGRPIRICSIKNRRDIVTELLAREGIDYHDIHVAAEEEARAKGWKRRF